MFQGVIQTVLLDKPPVFEWVDMIRIKLDQFSSITVWLMTRKTDISEKFMNVVFQDLPIRVKNLPFIPFWRFIWATRMEFID